MTGGPYEPCPGLPHRCQHALDVIARALDGLPSMARIDQLRHELGDCHACIQALDFEIGFKIAMAQRCREDAPDQLQIRISESLRRVDLGDIDVTDL